jgi:hypothetical protein
MNLQKVNAHLELSKSVSHAAENELAWPVLLGVKNGKQIIAIEAHD